MGELTKIALMSVIVSVLFLSFGTIMNRFSSDFGVPTKDIGSLNVISETYNQTEALKTQLEDSSVSASDPVNAFLVITNSGLQAVTLFVNLPRITLSLISDFFTFVPGIPLPIISAAQLFVLIVVVFLGLVPLILRSKTP